MLSACQVKKPIEILEQPASAFSSDANVNYPGQPLSSADYVQALDFYRELTSDYLDHFVANASLLEDSEALLATSRTHMESLGYQFSDSAFMAERWRSISFASTNVGINSDFFASLYVYDSEQQILDAFTHEIERLGEPDEGNYVELLHLTMTKLTIEAIVEHPELMAKYKEVNENGAYDPQRCALAVVSGVIGGAFAGALTLGKIATYTFPAFTGHAIIAGGIGGAIGGGILAGRNSEYCDDEAQ